MRWRTRGRIGVGSLKWTTRWVISFESDSLVLVCIAASECGFRKCRMSSLMWTLDCQPLSASCRLGNVLLWSCYLSRRCRNGMLVRHSGYRELLSESTPSEACSS